MSEQHFPLEKILNVTPTEYCTSVGKELNEYELIGVHVGAGINQLLIEEFQKVVPKDAEVVVGYTPHYSYSLGFITKGLVQQSEGTALIPKK